MHRQHGLHAAGDVAAVRDKCDFPVVGVDWCDADAFCEFAGKRLCGAIGGGSLTLGNADGGTSQWYVACSMGGTRIYPYGNTYAAGECADGAEVIAVASTPTCQSYPGVFDLSGNTPSRSERMRIGHDACQSAAASAATRAATSLRRHDVVATHRPATTSRILGIREAGFRCCR